MEANSPAFTVLGAGSWGSALAMQLARAGHTTYLWSHSPEHVDAMQASRSNERFLPGITFPDNLVVSADLEACLSKASNILIVVPSHAFREILQRIKPHLTDKHRIAWGTKGLEKGSRKLLHQIVAEEGITVPVAAVSGPTFAGEVARDLPGAITVASKDAKFASELAIALHSKNFLAYTSDDVIGVEIGGAAKNVMAIAAGIADGMGFGTNTRAALITRGLNEIMHLGVALGGQRETFMGLSGLGDLVLTCSDDQSRNRRFGLALGKGLDPEQAKKDIGQVIEGIGSSETIYALAKDNNVEMPITEQVYKVLHEDLPPREAVRILMDRNPKPESD
ncbi:MAG: NAD(P)H-dependent glycerol-3-phosphate dehydrogenase [Thioalkalispiraceae bacterium]|jgi:glycerol-3-phosphate dehydrogenase (NAD(P)+)